MPPAPITTPLMSLGPEPQALLPQPLVSSASLPPPGAPRECNLQVTRTAGPSLDVSPPYLGKKSVIIETGLFAQDRSSPSSLKMPFLQRRGEVALSSALKAS